MLASNYHQQVNRQFSRAAANYLQYSAIQREFGQQLLQMAGRAFEQLGDIGCGPAAMTRQLLEHCQHYHGIDLSSEMIAQAQQHVMGDGQPSVQWHIADAEQLPLGDQQLDGYYANMSLQWCHDFNQALAEMKRVLKTDGVGLFSLPIEGTFNELSQSFALLDNVPHTQRFMSLAQIERAMTQTGFQSFQCEVTEEVQWFDSVTDALRSIKGVGANYVAREATSGLLSPRRFAGVVKHYEQFRTERGIPLRWRCALIKAIS